MPHVVAVICKICLFLQAPTIARPASLVGMTSDIMDTVSLSSYLEEEEEEGEEDEETCSLSSLQSHDRSSSPSDG